MEAAADQSADLSTVKYRAMHTALKAISEAAGPVSSGKLLKLLTAEVRSSIAAGSADAVALAYELQDTLAKCNLVTQDLSGHRFSSRGAKWYFDEKCAPPPPRSVGGQ